MRLGVSILRLGRSRSMYMSSACLRKPERTSPKQARNLSSLSPDADQPNTVHSIDGIDRLSSRLPLTSLKHELAVIWAPAPTICGRPAAHRVLIRVADDELAGEGAHLRKRDASISSGLFDQICHSDVLVHSSGPTLCSAIESFRGRIFTLVTADCYDLDGYRDSEGQCRAA